MNEEEELKKARKQYEAENQEITMKLLKVMRRFVEKKMTSQKLTNSYLF